MRVAHVITRLIVGGAQENTIASVLGLLQKPGLEVSLISGPAEGPEGSLESRVSSVPGLLRLMPHLTRPVHPLKDLAAFGGLVKCFRDLRPDIVHTHSGKAGVLGRLAAARAGVPIIIHTIHGPSFGRFQGTTANLLFGTAERLAARVTTHFVCVAEAMKHQYLEAGIGREQMYSVIRSGFDLDAYLHSGEEVPLRHRLGLKPEHIVIGKIARLFKLKGHEDLFSVAPELVKRNPAIRFLIVGDGNWRAKFERQVDSLGLAHAFIFCGLVGPEMVPQYVKAMDILAHLSLREGLPRALPQALAAGKPVVAYDCDGAREVCRDNETGLLVPAGDKEQLHRSILKLVNAPELRKRLGEKGRELVKQQFAVGDMIDSLHDLYGRLTAEASKTPSHAR